MGQTTPNMSIYVPAAGETNYDASFLAGMINVDQHDHSGPPNKGVQISTTALADGSVTYSKLNANVVDVSTGIGVNAGLPNQLQMLGILKNLYQLAVTAAAGYVSMNGHTVVNRSIVGTTDQIAVANGSGVAGNTTLSLSPIIVNPTQPAFLANAGSVSDVTGDGTEYTAIFSAGGSNAFNQGSYFDGVSTFTAPKTGVYLFEARLNLLGLTAAMTGGQIKIVVNGTLIYADFDGNIGAIRNTLDGYFLTISQICKLTAADTVQVKLEISGGALVADINDGFFSGVLLS